MCNSTFPPCTYIFEILLTTVWSFHEFDPLMVISGQLDGDQDNGKGKKKMKVKGRNKQRPVTHIKSKDKLCPTIFQEKECSFGEKCKFSHDIKGFMESKPKDIGSHCFMFETYGKCPYGLACRYGSKHISEDFKNIVNQELYEKKSKVSCKKHYGYLLCPIPFLTSPLVAVPFALFCCQFVHVV